MAAFFVARRNGPEVFETVDGALDDIAAFVSLGVESWWRAAAIAFAYSAFARIQTLGTDTLHAAPLDLLSIMACAISAVHT